MTTPSPFTVISASVWGWDVLAFVQSVAGLPEGATGKELVAFFQQHAPPSSEERENMKQIMREIATD